MLFKTWRNVICNVCVLMTEIKTIEGGQKDALLGGPMLKKIVKFCKVKF